MGWTQALLWLLYRRLPSSWVLLAVTTLGVLAAVTLLAVGAGYSRVLAEGGLRHTLQTTPQSVLDAWIIVENRPLGAADYQRVRTTVEQTANSRLGSLVHEMHRSGRTQPNLPLVSSPQGESADPEAVLGRPFFHTDFAQHSRLVQGRWPEAAPVLHAQGVALEAVVGRQTAAAMQWKVGAQLYLVPFRADPPERITLTVVGLADPIDPNERFWMGFPAYFNLQDYGGRPLAPLFVPEDAFFGGLGARYPSLVGDYSWYVFMDTNVLRANTAEPARAAMLGLETDINKQFPRSLVMSGLKNTLADYQRRLTLARVSLFLFISLVVVVILYFLAVVVGMLARTRSDEASLLRSRGASFVQVMGLLAVAEGTGILLAVAAGPFLALALVRGLLLGTVNPAAGPAGGGADSLADSLNVTLGADMFWFGAIGGVLALGALLASGSSLARLGVVEFLRLRARPPTLPFLQRYYLDLLALGAVGLVWWQIRGRGGFVEQGLAARTPEVVDPSLLLGPALGLLAAALLAARVMPWLLRPMSWAGHRWAPSWASFALTRMARDPLPYGSLAVIVMLSAALGVFGASFQSTLSRSQQEQARYGVGGDLVVTGAAFEPSLQLELSALPGAGLVSPIIRESATLLGGFSDASVALVAVDPGTLPSAAWYRSDLSPSGKDLRQLLEPLRQGAAVSMPGGTAVSPGLLDPTLGIPIPPEASSIGVWVNTAGVNLGPLNQPLNIWTRVTDAGGKHRDLLLGALPPAAGPVWVYQEAPLPPLPDARPDPSSTPGAPGTPGGGPSLREPQWGLVAIFLTGSSFARMPPGSISLDDITVKGPTLPPAGVVIEGHEAPGGWAPLAHTGPVADVVERTRESARSGQAGLSYSWDQGGPGETPRGAFLPPGPFPLPAIGGPTFTPGQEVRLRAGRQVLPVTIREVTDFFPTIDPSLQPFLLVSLADYNRYLARVGGGAFNPPQEVWIEVEESANRDLVLQALGQRFPSLASVRDGPAAAQLASRDPLAGGGWDGLTLIALGSLTLTVVLALGIHAVVSVKAQRVDLAVVKALGLSSRQLFLGLALERAVVIVLALAAGCALGFWLGQWVLGFLDLTSSGREVVPPMVFTVRGWLVGVVILNLVGAALLSVALAAWSASRIKAFDILRTAG
ncbi:MAG: ABC transporter permease [Dehalococcoidia bacterium]|nr:ABC transporter permease [Dehalococcoidia bacterium]